MLKVRVWRQSRRCGGLSAGSLTLLATGLLVAIQTLHSLARAEDPPSAPPPTKEAAGKDPAAKESPAKESPPQEPTKEPAAETSKEPSGSKTPEKSDSPASKEPSKAPPAGDTKPEPAADSKKTARPSAQPTRLAPFTRPRQWLELFGVDDSYFDHVLDGREVDESESEALLRMMHAVRRFPSLEMHRLQSRNASWLKWTEDPAEHRGDLIHLKGRIIRIALEQPVPEVAERFSLESYYRCDFLIGEERTPAIVYALDLPQAWHIRTLALLTAQGVVSQFVPEQWAIDQHLSERASFEGFFFKRGNEPPDPRPVFVAKRIAWHPDTPLGDLDMDVGMLDQARMKVPLVSEDRECFYEMLAALGRADLQELQQLTDRPYSVVPLFNDPEQQKGQLVSLEGTARRALRVQVGEGDADIRERFGIDGYYEIELFTIDSQRNPIIFCVREIPHGMPTGEEIDVDLKIAGFFMKTYAYPSQRKFDAQGNKIPPGRFQLAPLLVGRKALLLVRPKAEHGITGWIAGAAIVVAGVGIWFISWRFNREGKKLRETTLNKFKRDVEPSFKDLGR